MINPIAHVPVFSPRRVACLLAVLLLIGFPSLAAARPAADDPPLPPTPRDLGDAPDSTNHFGAAMAAYPGVPANFPTVFDPATGLPRGPRHFMPKADSWLGANVSGENDADLLPDADGVRNITPPANHSDDDRFDDGVLSPSINPYAIQLPQCQQTNFNYIVSGAAAVVPHAAYVNVWIDFNRDGDWADILSCVTSAGLAVSVPEWAVQNQKVLVIAGGHVHTTQSFQSYHPTEDTPTWMRITLAERPAPLVGGIAESRASAGVYQSGETIEQSGPLGGRMVDGDDSGETADGHGPVGGYESGETEDYLLYPMSFGYFDGYWTV
jgi:hypothetical protein